MIVVRGNITKREQRTAATGGPEFVFLLEQPHGPSIPVVWRGPTSVNVGDVVEASGDQDSDGYLNAASIQKASAPPPLPPPEKPQLFVFRAFMGSFLGDLLALLIAAKVGKSNKPEWTVFVLLGTAFSSGLAALFAGRNRKSNAFVGAAVAMVLPLCIYLLIKALQK